MFYDLTFTKMESQASGVIGYPVDATKCGDEKIGPQSHIYILDFSSSTFPPLLSDTNLELLERVQNEALRAITRTFFTWKPT